MLLCKKRFCSAKGDAATSVDVVDLDFERSAVKILAYHRNILRRQCNDRRAAAITLFLRFNIPTSLWRCSLCCATRVSDEHYLKFNGLIAVCSLQRNTRYEHSSECHTGVA
jgi:hypothetical protein